MFSQDDEDTDVKQSENSDDGTKLGGQAEVKSPGPPPKKEKGNGINNTSFSY